MRLLFKNFCPNCGGNISNERLELGTLCSKCLPKPYTKPYLIWKYLTKNKKLENYEKVLKLSYQLSKIRTIFKKTLGTNPTPLQEVWIKRILLKKSFSIIAPTGIGKTTVGIIISIYLAKKDKNVYLVFPTTLLVQQAEQKLKTFLEKLKTSIEFVSYHGGLKQKQKKEVKEKIKNNNFSILITTDRFIVNNFELLENKKFDFIFVDDVDSFLKSSKNIDKIVKLLGGDEKLLEIATKIIAKQEVTEEEEKYLNEKKGNLGIIVFSSATAKQRRTKKIRLFREIFGFDIGFKPEFLRNIEDYFLQPSEPKKELIKIVKKLGKGGLVYVPIAMGKEKLGELKQFLENNNIRAEIYDKPKKEIIERFESSEIDLLLGIASIRSPLSRGLDLPQTIRYALFFGVPRFEIPLSTDTYIPTRLLALANILLEVVEENRRVELIATINKLKKIMTLTKEQIQQIEEMDKKGIATNDFLSYALSVIKEAQRKLKEMLNKEIIKKIEESKELRLKKEGNEFKVVVPDAVAYLQSSGRTSRLFIGGISKGIAITFVDDQKAFHGLAKKIEYYIDDFEFKEFKWKEVAKAIKEVDKDRETIKKVARGEVGRKEMKEMIKASLIIVESPTKARTIARLFGRPAKREVNGLVVNEISIGRKIINIVASVGHVLDLVENQGFDGVIVNKKNEHYEFVPIYDSIKKCKRCGEQFVGFNNCPKCGSEEIMDKRNIIEALRNLALEANEVIIATDADAEGEKIGYDLMMVLKPYNKNIRRMEFHEVTRKAINNALENLREIDKNLVNAQVLRRIQDRWIGFELSKVLMRRFRQTNLSAGRVQTPVLGWIINRTKEAREKVNLAVLSIRHNNKEYFFSFSNVGNDIKKVDNIEIKTKKERISIKPFPPFTTDALIREANKILKFSAQKTMKIAQQLFEMGLITYHRTDSTQVSSFGINLAKKYLEDKGLLEIFSPRTYRTEGAHECIRPTRPIDKNQLIRLVQTKVFVFGKKLTKDHYALYDLIFRRFIMSQCKPAKVVKQKIKAYANSYFSQKEIIVQILEEGFLKFQKVMKEPPLKDGKYPVIKIKLLKVPKRKPYTQGEIVLDMKTRKIGRPSTYAKIVSTILQRKYAKEIKGFLSATKRGEMIYDYLINKYYELVNEEATRKLEEEMNKIEKGKLKIEDVIKRVFLEVKEKLSYS